MTDQSPLGGVEARDEDGIVVCEVFIGAPPQAVFPYLVDLGAAAEERASHGEGLVHFLVRLVTAADVTETSSS